LHDYFLLLLPGRTGSSWLPSFCLLLHCSITLLFLEFNEHFLPPVRHTFTEKRGARNKRPFAPSVCFLLAFYCKHCSLFFRRALAYIFFPPCEPFPSLAHIPRAESPGKTVLSTSPFRTFRVADPFLFGGVVKHLPCPKFAPPRPCGHGAPFLPLLW